MGPDWRTATSEPSPPHLGQGGSARWLRISCFALSCSAEGSVLKLWCGPKFTCGYRRCHLRQMVQKPP